MDAFVMYTINTMYIIGILSVIVSVLCYFYLPKAMRILFDQDISDGDNNECSWYSDILHYSLLDGRANL